MGGGDRNVEETPKRLRPRGKPEAGLGGVGQVQRGYELETHICEREQNVTFPLAGEVQVGETIRVVLGQPPAIVAGARTVGRVSERRQAATLVACINDGYQIIGQVVAIDPKRGEGSATVVGVRNR